MGRRALLGRAAALGLGSMVPAAARPAASAATPETFRRAVDAAILPLMARHRVPGMAVAVTRGGRASFFQHGVAARGSSAPVTPTTLFELGSVSKTFAATLAGQAQALGRLDFDDAPGRHLPWLRDTALDRATLLHLGTYTAGGLPLQFPDEVRDEAGIEAYFRSFAPTAAPGTQRLYSNPSIALLGRIAATALGQGYADALDQGLLPQLGLRNSFVRVSEAAAARYAWGENARGEPVRVNPGPMADEAYGVKSCAEDMIRFVQLNLDASGLPATLQQALASTQQGHFRTRALVQGLGWEQLPYPAATRRLQQGHTPAMLFEPQPVQPVTQPPWRTAMFNKTGSTGGFGCYVAFVPGLQIGVVLLANRSYPIADRVGAGAAILAALAALPA